jgi:hypothetical protein
VSWTSWKVDLPRVALLPIDATQSCSLEWGLSAWPMGGRWALLPTTCVWSGLPSPGFKAPGRRQLTSCFCTHLGLQMSKGCKQQDKSLVSLPLICFYRLWAILSAVILQPPWNPGRTALIDYILWQESQLPPPPDNNGFLFFSFFCSTGAWTQGLPFEPLLQPFLWWVFPTDICFLSS